MKSEADLLLNLSKNFLKLAQETSIQEGEIYAALEKSGKFDIKNGEFNLNGPVADKIFGVMEKFDFKGIVKFHAVMDTNKAVDLLVVSEPKNDKLNQTLKNMFLSDVKSALAVLKGAPAEKIVTKFFIQAQL